MSDHNEESYQTLANRVKEISQEAYDYMIEQAPLKTKFNHSICLSECFYWLYTPQGYKFWADIAIQLEPPFIDEELKNTLKETGKY